MTTTNVVTLRKKLLETFDALQGGDMDVSRAKEISRAACAILSSAKAEIDYAMARKEAPDIDFFKR